MFDFFYKIKFFLKNIYTSYMVYIYYGLILSFVILLLLLLFLPLWISLILMPIITYLMYYILNNDNKDKNCMYSTLIGCIIVLFFGILIYL